MFEGVAITITCIELNCTIIFKFVEVKMRKEIIICGLIGLFIIIPTTSVPSYMVEKKDTIQSAGSNPARLVFIK